MSNPSPPAPLHTLTLEALCDELVSGRAVSIGDNVGDFVLGSPESRAILDWYRRNPGKWAKNVQKEDVEAIVDQLSKDAPVLPATASAVGSGQKRTLHLKSLRAHRFGGIHRYGEPDQPPPEFFFEFRKPVTLIEGSNGAGKTSLLNAIMWCLTGYAARSQRPPELINQAVAITLDAGNDPSGGIPQSLVMSPITPLPSAETLGRLGDKPLILDTWVELVFVDEEGQEAGKLRRAVRRGAHDSVTVTSPDFAALGLDPLMREVGTRMPALIPYIELGTSSVLGKAVAELIGLKPLEDLARHVNRTRTKLAKDLRKEREAEVQKFDSEFLNLAEELGFLIADNIAIEPGFDLPKADTEGVNEILAKLATHFDDLQARTLGGAREVLGDAFDDSSRSARADLVKNIGPALGQVEPSQLGRLESASRLSTLGKLTETELDLAEALVRRLCEEATEVAALQNRPDHASRLRLYARVVGWIKDHSEPPHVIEDCPICQGVLEGKVDSVTGRVVTDHLLEFLANEKNFLENTVQSWEQAAEACLVHDLPEALRRETERDLPVNPTSLITEALGHEIFNSPCFRGNLAALKPSTLVLCERFSSAQPPFLEPTIPTFPACFKTSDGSFTEMVTRTLRAIAFARWRRQQEGPCREAFAAIIGHIESGYAERPVVGDEEDGPRPLAIRLQILDRLVKNASPIEQALAKIKAMKEALAGRCAKRERIAQYARASEILQELLKLPSLVEGQVAFLTRTLGESTARWKGKLYKPAFVGAPGATSPHVHPDGTVSITAEANGVSAPAQHIGNTAELRATLFAFLLAFWEHLLETRGGLALFLIDDPQELFDSHNRRRMAKAIPAITNGKSRVVVTTLDFSFGRDVVATMRREDAKEAIEYLRIHPPNGCTPLIALGPLFESVEQKRRAFDRHENDAQIARDYLTEVRIYLELRLCDLFDTPEPGLPSLPTLADLVDAVRARNHSGREPFVGRAFFNLVSDPALSSGSLFLTLLNQCHHKNADQITYQEVFELKEDLHRVFGLVQTIHDDYERWLRRDPNEAAAARPEVPAVLTFPSFDVPLFENLAAFTGDFSPSEVSETEERLSTASLNDYACYVVNCHNFGFAGPKNCRALVIRSDDPIGDNRLVIALHRGKTYARRLIRNPTNPAIVVLVSEAVDPTKRPPSLMLPAEEVRLMQIAGILFDDRPYYPKSSEEAVLAREVDSLRKVELAFKVRGESALPLARHGQTVLAGPSLSPDQLGGIEGTLVAISTSEGAAFKRLGGVIPGAKHVRHFEAIGGLGASLLVRSEEIEGDLFAHLPLLQAVRPVLGVIYD